METTKLHLFIKEYPLKISLITFILFWFTSQSFAQLNADFLRHKKLADDCFAKKDYECAIKQYTIANKVKRDDYCLQQIEKCEKKKNEERERGKIVKKPKQTIYKLDPDFLRQKKLADDCFAKKDYECAIEHYTLAETIKQGDNYCLEKIEKCKKNKAVKPFSDRPIDIL